MKKQTQTLLFGCLLGLLTCTHTNAQILAERLQLKTSDPEKIKELTIDAAKDGDLVPLLLDEAPYVERLTITNLETFHEVLYELRFLRQLTIRQSSFTTMPKFKGWPQWVNLEYLSIRAQLTNVPEELWDIRTLKLVDLSNNQLGETPKAFINNAYIQELDLSKNSIQKIDTSIVKMVSLKRLILNDNQITHLPAAIFKLPSLELLKLDRNLLRSIDTDINQFSPLEIICLRHNQLIALPKELSRLKNLVNIVAFHNHLEDIPEEIFEHKKEFWLEIIEGNKLTKERTNYLLEKYNEKDNFHIL